MTELYGSDWKNKNGPVMPDLWKAELMSMTPNEAALGWNACKASGDTRPCNLPMFTRRVSEALASRRPIIPEYKPLPAPPRAVNDAMATGTKAAAEKAAQVDVQRLSMALGGRPVLASWPRRTILRGMAHPAGEITTRDVERLRAEARAQGRSRWDLDLELMAHNGWTPDDEVSYEKALPHGMRLDRDKGETPFYDRWRETDG